MLKFTYVFAFLLIALNSFALDKLINGKVYGSDEYGHKSPLVGANVIWLGTMEGTVTNSDGSFSIENEYHHDLLVISFIGYTSDTVEVKDNLQIVLNQNNALEGVEVREHIRSTIIDFLDPIKVEQLGEKELLKAACCNLSESFETTPSIDISFSDAITGTRQIQLLGLSSKYTMISRENMPLIRGMLGAQGMALIPGSWVQSIQLNKGSGSVVNGFESMTGQINVELWKPENAKKFYGNIYVNEGGRAELNLVYNKPVKKKWHTGLMIHGKQNLIRWDRNEDGFLDKPIGLSFIGLNRWKFSGDNGVRFQAAVMASMTDMLGGELEYDGTSDLWGMNHTASRADVWAKLGKVFKDKPWRSIGLQLNASNYDHQMGFGNYKYDATQSSFYSNFIYQGMIGNTNHTFKTGASLQWDDYDEVFEQSKLNRTGYNRNEYTSGVYYEYTYKHLEKISLVAGLRADYNNLYDWFYTPRFHFRYEFLKNVVFRGSAGLGYRTANVFADNFGLMASARTWVIMAGDNGAYGLNQERSRNIGASITHDFKLDYRKGTWSVEYFYTQFDQQVVVDFYNNPNQVIFSNLDGDSYAHAAQIQLDYELVKRLDVRIAYRYSLAKMSYANNLLPVPLTSRQRAFINAGYKTRKQWKFDLTLNWQGSRPVPLKESPMLINDIPYEDSPDFITVNAQISKSWKDQKWEVYLGVENLFNYRQDNPIISADDPFSESFDASLIWGPIFGRNTYAGLRYKL